MRCDLVGTSALVLAFVASVGLAAAQQQPPPNASPPANAVLVNGALAVPGAPANTDTVPAKFSAKNAADDKLITLAYTFKTLTDEDRRAIYQALKAADEVARGPAGAPHRRAPGCSGALGSADPLHQLTQAAAAGPRASGQRTASDRGRQNRRVGRDLPAQPITAQSAPSRMPVSGVTGNLVQIRCRLDQAR